MERQQQKTIPTLDHPSDDIKVRAAETQTPETTSETLSKGLDVATHYFIKVARTTKDLSWR
jgi:hypothetical protein